MAHEANFTMPAEDFPLGTLFTDLPDVTVELERIVPTHNRVLPYFWVWDADPDRVLDYLRQHSALSAVELVDTVADGGLHRPSGTWTSRVFSWRPSKLT